MEPRRSGATSAPTNGSRPRLTSNNAILNTILVVLLIITSIVASAYLILRLVTTPGTNGSQVKTKQYQALFLTNGQVYFGHLANVDGSYVKLSDIYYLQVQQQVQPGQSNNTNNQKVSLAKLGNELHGPEDQMYVSRDQVLFWENLKNSGKVVQAIQSYQNSQNK